VSVFDDAVQAVASSLCSRRIGSALQDICITKVVLQLTKTTANELRRLMDLSGSDRGVLGDLLNPLWHDAPNLLVLRLPT
jgi:hypothetical protein